MRGNGAKYRGERGGGRLRRGWEERGECGRRERMVKDEKNKGSLKERRHKESEGLE